MKNLQGHTMQHKKHNQYFTITLKTVQSLKIVDLCIIHLKLVNQLYVNHKLFKNKLF